MTEGSESDRVKALAELKKRLEERVAGLERELELMKLCISLVDESLTKISFKPAAEVMAQPRLEVQLATPSEVEGSIRSKLGVLLAKFYTGADYIKVVPTSNIEFNVKTPPFTSFLLNKFLEGMRRGDADKVERGELEPGKAITFDVKLEGDIIKEIVVRNVREDRQFKEVKNAVRWTLERMYEKMR